MAEEEFQVDGACYFITPHLCKQRDEAGKLSQVNLFLITVCPPLLAAVFQELPAQFYKWLMYLQWQQNFCPNLLPHE